MKGGRGVLNNEGSFTLSSFMDWISGFVQSPAFYVLMGLSLGVLVLGIVLRLIFGKESKVCQISNDTASLYLGMLILFVCSITLFGVVDALNIPLTVIPVFGTLTDAASLMDVLQSDPHTFWAETLELLFLSILVSVFQKMIHKYCKYGERFFFQCTAVFGGMVVYLIADRFLPAWVIHGLMIGVLSLFYLIGTLYILSCIFHSATFFTTSFAKGLLGFLSKITSKTAGKVLSKALSSAVLSTTLLTVTALALDRTGFSKAVSAGLHVVSAVAIGVFLICLLWCLWKLVQKFA